MSNQVLEGQFNLDDEQIRKRVTFVGDRIALVMIFSFGIDLIAFLLFDYFDVIEFLPYWFYLVLVFIGVGCFIAYVVTNEAVYYRDHILANSNYILVQVIWFCFSIPPATGLAIVFGWNQIIGVTTSYLMFYFTGYILARILWRKWPTLSKNIKIISVLITLMILLVPTLVFGIYSIIIGNNYIGILIMIYGIGSVVTMGVSALTLHSFYDKGGLDVIEDPPSKLIIIGVVNTMILNFILWIILCTLFPIVAAGGSKKKSSSSSKKSSFLSPKRNRTLSFYRRRLYYGRRSYVITHQDDKPHPRASTTHYWLVAQGLKEPTVEIPQIKIDEAKQKIVDVLKEEKVVPTSNDLRRLIDMPHLVFDIALDQLINERAVSFNPQTKSEWWMKGYTLTDYYSRQLDITKKTQAEIKQELGGFLNKISENQPIKTRKELWDLGDKIGVRPRWRINAVIYNFIKEGRIKYSHKEPKGWYVP